MEIINIEYSGTGQSEQSYAQSDLALINASLITNQFGDQNDYIEYFIKDLNGTVVVPNYNLTTYKLGQRASSTTRYTSLYLDPQADLEANGITRGTFNIKYNFYKRLMNSGPGAQSFWIKEISPSGTEIKVARQDLSNTDLLTAFNSFNSVLSNFNYYPDFLLNFGADVQIIGVNALYIEENGVGYILIKLYEPLPSDIDLKAQFWIVQKLAESAEYQVSIEVEPEVVIDQAALRGPNYKVAINQRVGQTTPYYNYTNLLATPASSSLQQLLSWLEDKAISINVDYSEFKNFIHFSSATERLLNFQYKVGLIEAYKQDMAAGSALINTPGTIISTTNTVIQQKIDNIINKFDGYEYYLYYESASTAWPKSNNIPPYNLYSVTSSQVLDWLGSPTTFPTSGRLSMLYSSSLYDNLNKDNIQYTVPTYLREDDNNQPYATFLNMIGQHFDNIWVYYKDLSNRYVADNNPNTGISLDVVAEALRGFGVSLYTNSNISDNIFYSILGINETGSNLPITSSAYAQINLASSSLFPPAGNEWLSASVYLPPFENEKLNRYVTTFVTPSPNVTSSFATIPPDKLEKEVYKRLYHNLPYLLKTKGTQRGVKALIACFGIPNTTLSVNEFGGYDIFAQPGIQQIQNEKVFTGSMLHLSGTLLSPFTTIQYYQNNTERGSIDVEVGFSPADSINAHITGTLGNFNIMQYLGAPGTQYSSSYSALTTLSNNYFATNYTSRYNVWDFIRIIKFYNNSLFKMVKDFVPARASLTSGIIVKSHILERNKYARHEPVAAYLDYSQSIDTAFITASNAPDLRYPTDHISTAQSKLGPITINNRYSLEPYSGEYGGTTIQATPTYFSQTEVSNIRSPWTASALGGTSMFTTYSLSYLYQNVTSSVISSRFFDLDYNSNQIVPSNYGLITQSINTGATPFTNPQAPWAQLQDYNYSARRSILPRYSGSKSTSLKYNVYTSASLNWPGDSSYGSNPAIDRNSIKIGWVKSIPSQSLNFPDKTLIALKYLVDEERVVTELSAHNYNLFEVQNIFKSGDDVIVSISDVKSPSNQVSLDGTKKIFRGGYWYDPILYRENNETLTFTYDQAYSSSTSPVQVKVSDAEIYDWSDFAFGGSIGTSFIVQTYTGNNARYVVDGVVQPNGVSFAYRAVLSGSWRYATDPNNSINVAMPSAVDPASYAGNQYKWLYSIDVMKFANLITNTDPIGNSIINSEGKYIYRVPRTSTYTITVDVPFYINIFDNRALPISVGCKVFVIVEKNTSINGTDDSWQYVASSELHTINTSPINTDRLYNAIWWQTGTEGSLRCKINSQQVTLSQNDYIRCQIYFYDHSNLHGYTGGVGTTGGVQYLRFRLNGESQKAFIQIEDQITTNTVYYTTDTVAQSQPVFVSQSNNVIEFNPVVTRFLTSASQFTPQAPTSNYYTPIIDTFSIKKYDLIRMGSFTAPAANYYEVRNAVETNRPPVTGLGPGDFKNIQNFQGGGTVKNRYEIASNLFVPTLVTLLNIGDTVVISGTTSNNITTTITNITIIPGPGQFPLLAPGLVIDFASTVTNEVNVLPTFSFPFKKLVVTLNNNFTPTTFDNQNFAILRPKENETSVILEFKKKPGAVAQTLLLPQDLSKIVKDQVGDIFAELNNNITP